jgi:hypothetical protein
MPSRISARILRNASSRTVISAGVSQRQESTPEREFTTAIVRPPLTHGLVWGDSCQVCCEQHLLVRSAGDISSSRPDFAGALRGAAVKGGRRPSRSDMPLTAASTAPDSLIRGRHWRGVPDRSNRQRRRYRGELAIGRASRATNLYSADPRVDTTMQSCASAAKLRGGGPILNRGAKAIVQRRVAAASVRHLQPSVNTTLGCSSSMVPTPPGEAADPPASPPWSRAATAR